MVLNCEAMQPRDSKDFVKPPEQVAKTLRMAAANAAHLARLLAPTRYPGTPG